MYFNQQTCLAGGCDWRNGCVKIQELHTWCQQFGPNNCPAKYGCCYFNLMCADPGEMDTFPDNACTRNISQGNDSGNPFGGNTNTGNGGFNGNTGTGEFEQGEFEQGEFEQPEAGASGFPNGTGGTNTGGFNNGGGATNNGGIGFNSMPFVDCEEFEGLMACNNYGQYCYWLNGECEHKAGGEWDGGPYGQSSNSINFGGQGQQATSYVQGPPGLFCEPEDFEHKTLTIQGTVDDCFNAVKNDPGCEQAVFYYSPSIFGAGGSQCNCLRPGFQCNPEEGEDGMNYQIYCMGNVCPPNLQT
eukprot:UN25491